MIYLDNAATTQVDEEVLNEMMPYFNDKYGNPGAVYSIGREAADAIAEQTGADVVQVIGSKFVLFKRNEKEPVIENIPKAK